MFITLLKNQRVTFVSDVEQAEKCSPYFMKYNKFSERYVVFCKRATGDDVVGAGMEKDDAEACVMFHANNWIYRNVQKGN